MLSRAPCVNALAAGRLCASLSLLWLLCTACSDGSAQTAPAVSEVYAKHRNQILDCAGVCEFSGWYFCSITVTAEGSKSYALNRAKLEAMHRIMVFIEDPALYERIKQGGHPLETGTFRYHDRLEILVLESGPVRSAGESRLGITVGARPIDEEEGQ